MEVINKKLLSERDIIRSLDDEPLALHTVMEPSDAVRYGVVCASRPPDMASAAHLDSDTGRHL